MSHKVCSDVVEVLGSSKMKQSRPSLVFLVTKILVVFICVFFKNNFCKAADLRKRKSSILVATGES
jgi:hypothetical protein